MALRKQRGGATHIQSIFLSFSRSVSCGTLSRIKASTKPGTKRKGSVRQIAGQRNDKKAVFGEPRETAESGTFI
jgi:hypothetical protein